MKVLQSFSFNEEHAAKRVSVSYVITCDDHRMDPELVTKALNIQPTSAWKKGEGYIGKTVAFP
ncbi:MAG TPA: hypothetical protein DHD79_03240 [Firmicutes bacterium]|jgi:hypothetical protein|nr:hypothetical protein [Bacillota bacterium]HAW71357.1 hypothetical protein [Bacillota bacterium]HAZ22221.1 hypothetical protein [Bacillota bacterium]HBE05536.1 hypothetical protein [Bacillota bacterium]HBL50915.1 hypothetical protein [Bacillota bacterium]